MNPYMKLAKDLAEKGVMLEEGGPFGAVITDKEGNVHLTIGRASFDDTKLVENFNTIYELLVKAKPSSAKGVYMKNVAVSSSMGPSVKVVTA